MLLLRCPSTWFLSPCAAEEFVMGHIKARCIPYAELFSNALVIFAQERERSTQCIKTNCAY